MVRGFASVNFRFFGGGGPSASSLIEGASLDFEGDLLPESCVKDGDGYPHGGVGDFERMLSGDEGGEDIGDDDEGMAEASSMLVKLMKGRIERNSIRM